MSLCHEVRLHLGGYVLDGLSAHEHAWVATHLESCPDCRSERDELVPLLPLMARVADAPPPVPAVLRERVLAAAGRQRASRTRRMIFAAAVMGGVTAIAVAVALLQPLTAPPATVLTLEPGDGFDALGEAALTDRGDRLRIELTLDRLAPLPDEGVYEAWLGVPDTEVPISIGTFDATADGTAHVTLTANGSLNDYSQIWVTAEPDAVTPTHDGPLVVGAMLPTETGAGQAPGG